MIHFEDVAVRFEAVEAPGRRLRHGRCGSALRAGGTFGLRQIHADAAGQPAGRAERRPRPGPRRGCRVARCRAAAAVDRLCHAVHRAVPAPQRRREHRRGAPATGLAAAAHRGPGGGAAGAGTARSRAGGAAAPRTLGRPGAACRAGPRAGRRPRHPADGRAFRRRGPHHPARPAGGVAAHPCRDAEDHPAGDARPGGGAGLASQIVVLRDGRVEADGPPAALVAPGCRAFARELLGGEQPGLRRLSLLPASEARDPAPAPPDAPLLPAGATLADALSRIAETGRDGAGAGGHGGSLRLDAILARGR